MEEKISTKYIKEDYKFYRRGITDGNIKKDNTLGISLILIGIALSAILMLMLFGIIIFLGLIVISIIIFSQSFFHLSIYDREGQRQFTDYIRLRDKTVVRIYDDEINNHKETKYQK